jgi:hypothetical protein
MPRKYVLDTNCFMVHSRRENGAVLISPNIRDFQRINQIFAFDWTLPFPNLS